MSKHLTLLVVVGIILVVGAYIGNWAAGEGVESVADLVVGVLCFAALVLTGLCALVSAIITRFFPGIGAWWLLLRADFAGGELEVAWPGERVEIELRKLQGRHQFSMRTYPPLRWTGEYATVINLRSYLRL